MYTIADLFDLKKTIAAELFDGLNYPWEALERIEAFILKLGPTLPESEYERREGGIWIAKDASVAPTASVNGPCIICSGAEIRHCAYIRGSAIIGRGSVVGNSCEVKNAVIFDGAQVPHFNYVGDSILGYKAHMGAGAITSNVKSDKSMVIIKDGVSVIGTGRKKVGAMLGDYAEIGCNSVLNPGAIIGRRSVVYPLSSVRGVIAADRIYKTGGVIVPKE